MKSLLAVTRQGVPTIPVPPVPPPVPALWSKNRENMLVTFSNFEDVVHGGDQLRITNTFLQISSEEHAHQTSTNFAACNGNTSSTLASAAPNLVGFGGGSPSSNPHAFPPTRSYFTVDESLPIYTSQSPRVSSLKAVPVEACRRKGKKRLEFDFRTRSIIHHKVRVLCIITRKRALVSRGVPRYN